MAFAYEAPAPDVCGLAALYMTGIARNQPFNDANKRTSLVTGLTFMALNGLGKLMVGREDIITTMLQVADGSMGWEDLAEWLRAGAVRRG